MTDCVLPVTGSDTRLVVLLALLMLGMGVALVLGVRRRGLRGGAAIVVAVTLGAAALVATDARRADAQECPPATTVAPTAAPTTIAASTTTSAATTTASTTTTAATTTTTVSGGGVPTNPTFPTSSTTTTTVAAPDLTPSVRGLQEVFLNDGPWVYTIDIRNIGPVATDGTTMMFTVSFPFEPAGYPGGVMNVVIDTSSASWTMSTSPGLPGTPGSPGTPTTVTFTSTPGFVIAAGADSNPIVIVDFAGPAPADFSVDVTLANGIGGETNGTNNTVSHPVDMGPPRSPPG